MTSDQRKREWPRLTRRQTLTADWFNNPSAAS